MSSTTVFQDVTIAGNEAYVDGSGVHVGVPGNPANPAILGVVDQALAATGLQIFFTAPYRVTIGGLTYDYAASVLLYWAPPEPNKDVLTVSLGGAAISMSVTPGLTGSTPTTAGPSGVPSSPGATTLSLPAAPAPSGGFQPPPPLSPVSRPTGSSASAPSVVALGPPLNTSSHGVGASWLVLLAALAVAGGLFLPRLPALLSGGANCNCERPYPTSREY